MGFIRTSHGVRSAGWVQHSSMVCEATGGLDDSCRKLIEMTMRPAHPQACILDIQAAPHGTDMTQWCCCIVSQDPCQNCCKCKESCNTRSEC